MRIICDPRRDAPSHFHQEEVNLRTQCAIQRLVEMCFPISSKRAWREALIAGDIQNTAAIWAHDYCAGG